MIRTPGLLTRADSMRGDTATDHTSFRSGCKCGYCLLSDLVVRLGALICAESALPAEWVRNLPSQRSGGFDFAFPCGAANGTTLDPLDSLFAGLDLQDREAGNEFLGFGKGAIDDGTRLA